MGTSERDDLVIGVDRLCALAGADRERFGGEIARLAREGLLEFYEDRVRLTARGRLLSNEVFQAFI